MKKKKFVITILSVAFVILFTAILSGAVLTASPHMGLADASVLKNGSRGSDVKTVQTRLKTWGYYKGAVDGIYGSQTVSAVKLFQKRNGLVADGIVGAKTASAIGIRLSGATSSSGGISSSDLNLLARVIYGEARGEPYTGQVAALAVGSAAKIASKSPSEMLSHTLSGCPSVTLSLVKNFFM